MAAVAPRAMVVIIVESDAGAGFSEAPLVTASAYLAMRKMWCLDNSTCHSHFIHKTGIFSIHGAPYSHRPLVLYVSDSAGNLLDNLCQMLLTVTVWYGVEVRSLVRVLNNFP